MIKKFNIISALSLALAMTCAQGAFATDQTQEDQETARSILAPGVLLPEIDNLVLSYIDSPTDVFKCLFLVSKEWSEETPELITRLNLHGSNIFTKLITANILLTLTNLSELDLAWNKRISGLTVRHLTNLRKLDITGNCLIADYAVRQLMNLEYLNLTDSCKISDELVKKLRTLDVEVIGRK